MDYGTRIADATNTKNASYGTYNQYAGQADQAYDKYNQQLDSSRGYGDIYDAARQKYMNTDEINAAKGAYQNSRDAVNQINTTINSLPESIRQQYGGTGLTEAQRARAMAYQQDKLARTYNYANQSYQSNLAGYQDLANRGMQETQNVAGGDYQRQQDMINQYQSRWGALLGQRNTSYGQYQQDLAALAGVNSEQDKWNLAQQQMELERWKEQQANDRAQKELNLKSHFADVEADKNKTAALLQSQLADKQSKADYNRYVNETKQGAADKQQKQIEDWWARLWDNDGVQSRAADDYQNTINNMLTYDQWVGNL